MKESVNGVECGITAIQFTKNEACRWTIEKGIILCCRNILTS